MHSDMLPALVSLGIRNTGVWVQGKCPYDEANTLNLKQ